MVSSPRSEVYDPARTQVSIVFSPRQSTKSLALLQNSSRVVLVGHPEVILRPAHFPPGLTAQAFLLKEKSNWKRITPGSHSSSRKVNHQKIGR